MIQTNLYRKSDTYFTFNSFF